MTRVGFLAMLLWCLAPHFAAGDVQQCYACVPDVKNGKRCDNPYEYAVQTCPPSDHDACITVHTDDDAAWRGCTEKHHCTMFPLFEEGECCYTDFCNDHHTFPTKKNFYLIAFIQFGLPLLTFTLSVVGMILTVFDYHRERRMTRKSSMSVAPSNKPSIVTEPGFIYVRPQTPMYPPVRQSTGPVGQKRSSTPYAYTSIQLKGNDSPQVNAPTRNQPPAEPFRKREPDQRLLDLRNIGSSGSSTSSNSLLLYESDEHGIYQIDKWRPPITTPEQVLANSKPLANTTTKPQTHMNESFV